MNILSVRDILHIHSRIIDETGGSHGVRDLESLKGVVDSINQEFGGKELYPDIHSKAAVYLHRILMNHPFVDGNKRTGVTCASVFLEDNGYVMTTKQGGFEEFAVHVVTEHLEVKEIVQWLEENSKQA